MADVHIPSGWPEAVAPPGTDDWEATAVEFPVKFFCSTDPAVATLFGPSGRGVWKMNRTRASSERFALITG